MHDRVLGHDNRSRDYDTANRSSDRRHWLTLVAVAVVLLIWRGVVRVETGGPTVSASSMTIDALITVGLFLVASVLIRVVELVVLRREITERAEASRELSREIRDRVKNPGRKESESREDSDGTVQATMLMRAIRPSR
jgi:hypothetical protein